jgi:hypothetical protein
MLPISLTTGKLLLSEAPYTTYDCTSFASLARECFLFANMKLESDPQTDLQMSIEDQDALYSACRGFTLEP